MLVRQYWAVLGFEIVLGLQITAMSLALVFAANVGAAALLVRAGRAARHAVLEAHPGDGAHADARRRPESDPAQPVQ